MSYTDQLLKSMCDKMDTLMESQRQIERSLSLIEQTIRQTNLATPEQHRKVKVNIRKPRQE